jgi:hypothetical protein
MVLFRNHSWESMMSEKLNQALAIAMSSIPECLAAAYVDLTSGLLMAVNTVESLPTEVMDMLAAASSDLFAGKSVVTIENMFKKTRGQAMNSHHFFQEVIVNSDHTIHVFLRGKRHPEHIACFVCNKSVNLGMALATSRAVLSDLETAI